MSKILMVDDDQSLLDLLQECLEENGHLVLTATKTKEAMKLFQDTKPELVIIDIIMPQVDGLDLLRQFKNSGFVFKSILLSGLTDDRLKEKASEIGADQYLIKPVSIDVFKETVSKILSN